jgi:hypothetical protein
MKRQQQAQPEYTVDADGQRLAHVALANTDRRATLYAEDYQRLIDAGFSPHWQYTGTSHGGAYVTLNAYTGDGYNRSVPVARLLTGAGRGERVRARDGNTLNLRIENLEFHTGRAWFNATDWHPTATAAQAAGVTMRRAPRVQRLATKRTASNSEVVQGAQRVETGKPQCVDVQHVAAATASQQPATYTPHVRDTAAASIRMRAVLDARTP